MGLDQGNQQSGVAMDMYHARQSIDIMRAASKAPSVPELPAVDKILTGAGLEKEDSVASAVAAVAVNAVQAHQSNRRRSLELARTNGDITFRSMGSAALLAARASATSITAASGVSEPERTHSTKSLRRNSSLDSKIAEMYQNMRQFASMTALASDPRLFGQLASKASVMSGLPALPALPGPAGILGGTGESHLLQVAQQALLQGTPHHTPRDHLVSVSRAASIDPSKLAVPSIKEVQLQKEVHKLQNHVKMLVQVCQYVCVVCYCSQSLEVSHKVRRSRLVHSSTLES